jgi:formylmethanofuran dehydrogenase subunit B
MPSPEARPATCGGCGLCCDDITAAVAGGALQRLERTCPRGDAWFAARTGELPALARLDGAAAPYETALDTAAEILAGARAPLVWGLGDTSLEAQRAAVALAEQIGATIDPAGAGAARAQQAAGASTATLGDVRDRAEVVVLWREDPETTHPRLLERLRLPRPGPALVVVDARRTPTGEHADVRIEVEPDDDVAALWALRALVAGRAPRAGAERLPMDALRDLAGRLTAATNVAMVYGDGLSGRPGGHRLVLALLTLVRDLMDHTHAVTLALRAEGNAAGAQDVLTWQTGYPAAVDFALGHPRSQPGEHSAAAVLARGDADAAVLVGSHVAEALDAEAAAALAGLPVVCLDHRATAAAQRARVAFVPAAAGVHRAGTAHRLDSVPVPLPALLASERPGADEVLAALGDRLHARRTT